MPRMETRALFVVGALGLAIAGCGSSSGWVVRPAPAEQQLVETVVASDPGLFVSDKIAVVDVDGLLMNMRETGLFGSGENPVSLFVEKIDKAQRDPHVKALVVRINSPGGGVTASDIMYQRLMRFRAARQVPVVTVIEDMGASGGYYLACASDAIVAHPTSVVGSIGVIVQTVSFSGAMKMLGIQAKAITSGQYKDMGSPLKPLEEKDQAILQGIVNDFYGRFVKIVATGRPKLTEEQVKVLADGRVYTGNEALANGLVDALGYMQDAVLLAKARSCSAKVKVVMYDRPLGGKENLYSRTPAGPPQMQMNMLNVTAPGLMNMARPQFLYLWTGQSLGE